MCLRDNCFLVQEIITNTFKHSGYLPHQQEVINATLNNLDVIAVMPTGGTYQVGSRKEGW
ncbi:putative P-loop containing nucleoside triphosphate hydrolase [Helianthus anomalus]